MTHNTTKKESGWLLPDRSKIVLDPGLYLVATPIGNLADISLRALDTLAAVDIVLCEDTRVSRKLLSHYGIQTRCKTYHDHSDERARAAIMDDIQSGKSFALISDAGMPLISDPGYKLVRDCATAGVYVTTIPGANAALCGLQLSGLPSDQFCFLGFAPAKSAARQQFLEPWREVSSSLLLYENARRLPGLLTDVAAVLGAREMAVVREITKRFEEVKSGTVDEMISHYTQTEPPKGEVVVVVGPPAELVWSEAQLNQALRTRLDQGESVKDAAADVADMSRHSRKVLYDMALKIKAEQKE